MEKKKVISVTIVGWLLFLPVVWYWVTQVIEWSDHAKYAVPDAGPFNWTGVFFPFGLPLSLAFITLGIGVLKVSKLCRRFAIVLNLLFIVVFTCCVPTPPPTGLIDWLQGHYGLLYPITILVVLNLPAVKEQFKKV